MLRTRLLSALIGIPMVIIFAYLGGLPWLAGVMLVGGAAWLELSRLLRSDGGAAYVSPGMAFVLAAILAAYLESRVDLPFHVLGLLISAFIILSLAWALWDRGPRPVTSWAFTLGGAVYLGVLASFLVGLRERSDGLLWLSLAIALTWTNDSMAFFTGRAIGKHKMFPRLSPKKTWEGFAGGLIATVVVAVAALALLLDLSPWLGVVLGAIVSIVGPIGDLSVSMFKRAANAKDSGNLIPGHGGILDRLDSLLFVLPVVAYFALIVTGK